MATSPVQICSNALLLLGDSPISSFDENNNRATLASNLWNNARQSVLRSHPWNCATEIVALAPDAMAPAFDWTYKFSIPSDSLRVLFVGQANTPDEYKVMRRKILSDENPLYLTYIFDETDVVSWDAMLVQAMEVYMAARMAYAITKSSALRDSFYAEYKTILKMSKAVDGQEDPPETLGDFPLIQARR